MGIAQLVEHLVVVQGVAGSSPVTHPNAPSKLPEINSGSFVHVGEALHKKTQTEVWVFLVNPIFLLICHFD